MGKGKRRSDETRSLRRPPGRRPRARTPRPADPARSATSITSSSRLRAWVVDAKAYKGGVVKKRRRADLAAREQGVRRRQRSNEAREGSRIASRGRACGAQAGHGLQGDARSRRLVLRRIRL